MVEGESEDAVHPSAPRVSPYDLTRTALCVEPRGGNLFVFMPPLKFLDQYLDLVATIEATASELGMPVLIEGYEPPSDDRIQELSMSPDPGVLEVNAPPSDTWEGLVDLTELLYEQRDRVASPRPSFSLMVGKSLPGVAIMW